MALRADNLLVVNIHALGEGSNDNFDLDASTDEAACVFQLREADTITHAHVRWSAIDGTAPTYTIELLDVDGNGEPGSTVHATLTNQPSSTGSKYLAFDASYAGSRGELVALRVKYLSGTVNASNNAAVRFAYRGPLIGDGVGFPTAMTSTDSGSTWTKHTTKGPNLGVKGTTYHGGHMSTQTTVGPNGEFKDTLERGLSFTFDRNWFDSFRVNGIFAGLNVQNMAGNTVYMSLYEDPTGANTLLQQVSFDGDLFSKFLPLEGVMLLFDEATLSQCRCGTQYVIAFATNTSSSNYWSTWTIGEAGARAAYAGGNAFHTALGRTHDPALTAPPSGGSPLFAEVSTTKFYAGGPIMAEVIAPRSRLMR